MDQTQTCSTCRFWKPEGDGGAGECRRQAPAAEAGKALPSKPRWAVWPLTAATDWCGEWGPKPAAQAAEGNATLREAMRLLADEMEAILRTRPLVAPAEGRAGSLASADAALGAVRAILSREG